MKSRSHRLPVANPQDDWVDGSWTVDCVCGVNFDDGEEMVNCDECGVWVHTRCVRYVKTKKLFACDKCKNKARRNDSEETEVAQLLVELPTNTLRMNPPYRNTVPIRKTFRLWTDLPMEERVHLQGVPGGDPALFSGLSSVFGRQLWKCSGYVPKKFNFQYTEFPCWDNETREARDNTSDKSNEMTCNGAGALFSLSRENCLFAPVVNPVSEKPVIESNGAMDSDATTRSTNDVKRGTGSLGPSMIQGNKRKKEEFGVSKDQSGKKKSKIVEKEGYLKKDAHASRSDRRPMAVKTDIQRTKFGREVLAAVDNGPRVLDHDTTSYSDIPTSNERFSKIASYDVSKRCSTSEAHPREDKIRNHVPARLEDSCMENDGAASNLERSGYASLPMTDTVVTNATNNKEEVVVPSLGTESQMAEPMEENVTCLSPNIKRHPNVESSSDDKVICSSELVVQLADKVHADPAHLEVQRSLPSDGKLDITKSLAKPVGTSSGCLSEKAEVNITTIVNSELSDCNLEEGNRKAMIGGNNTTNTDESPSALCQSNQEPKISEVAVGARNSSGHKQSSKPAEDAPRSSSAVTTLSAPNHRKVVLSMGKSSSGTTKSSAPESRTSSKAHNNDSNGRLRGMSGSNLSNKRESSSMDAGRDEERCERPKKMLKELPKSSVGSASKTLQSTKLSHAPVKKTVSEAKDSVPNSSAKTSIVRSNPASSRSAESSTSLQSESAAHIQNKATGTHLTQKGEKINQPSCQPSSKVNTHLMHPPSSSCPAALSDEELALLLHQELNSSPRVPRVPRMCHAGSLPQLTSPTSTSMLMKRTSSGGKDHGLTFRRKSKDIGKDGSNCSQEVVQETKKSDRSTSPGCRREGDAGSAKSVQSLKKNYTLASNTSASSSLCSPNEANEQNLSSKHNSPSTAADDDAKVVGHPSHQTLPGLIAEIMSKGQRMTYEELCNAVLPHWPNLRKHNGERYAYSSHSQAVLDCLRNRSEWSRLVDRGPKTTTSRKRRKLDVDSQFTESEDNEDCMDRGAKDVRNRTFESKQEEFPKGKRKARKRRRLALQGRGIKDMRRRHRAEVSSDEEIGSSSESGGDSMFSEDEVQGGETSAGNEASASSDERAAMS
ncbi:hypothetical protein K7X08_013435 [Anisodus acutangulus]|uniref:Zinc finger PHD-type domain-containing protein n=1 Tax=Anisodus acutangulus TaxID=402998 RepID=A0A9Q1MEF3_9SOLA|nr:hypothetical protein K7X08_013435 [Anisodus acutangulus]